MQDHRRLRVYTAAQKLGVEVYRLAHRLPASERYALGDQLRRGAVSVGSNIAEGSGRTTSRDFASYLDNALAAVREIDFQLGHAEAAGLLPTGSTRDAAATASVIERMLVRLLICVRKSDP